MNRSDSTYGGPEDELPSHSVEKHLADYDHRGRFPDARVIAAADGGSVLVADDAGGAYVITDESTLATFLDEEDTASLSFVVIRRFESATDRDRYCEIRFGRLIRATERLRNYL